MISVISWGAGADWKVNDYRFFVKILDLICRAMGFRPTDEELKDLLEEVKITNLPIDQLSYWPIGQMANLPIT